MKRVFMIAVFLSVLSLSGCKDKVVDEKINRIEFYEKSADQPAMMVLCSGSDRIVILKESIDKLEPNQVICISRLVRIYKYK